jgi:hypothetical protein
MIWKIKPTDGGGGGCFTKAHTLNLGFMCGVHLRIDGHLYSPRRMKYFNESRTRSGHDTRRRN